MSDARIDCWWVDGAIECCIKDVLRAFGDKMFSNLNICTTRGSKATKMEVVDVVRCCVDRRADVMCWVCSCGSVDWKSSSNGCSQFSSGKVCAIVMKSGDEVFITRRAHKLFTWCWRHTHNRERDVMFANYKWSGGTKLKRLGGMRGRRVRVAWRSITKNGGEARLRCHGKERKKEVEEATGRKRWCHVKKEVGDNYFSK